MLVVFFALCYISSDAQEIVNGGFEDWVWDYDTPYPRPAGWECNNYKAHALRADLPVQACVISRSGRFSTLLWNVTDSVTLDPAPAHLWQSVQLHGERPEALSLYTRYDLSDDGASIEVEFFGSGHFLHREIRLLSGQGPVDSFGYILIPIHYPYQVVPDVAIVHIRSSAAEHPSGLSGTISIDDIRFQYHHVRNIGTIFPNPVSGPCYLPVEGFGNTTLSIEWYDVSGRLIGQKEYAVEHAFENVPLGIPGGPGGVYFYRIRCGSDAYIRKVVQ